MDDAYYATVKGILLGESGTGKTSLFEKCCRINRFVDHHIKTIGVDTAFCRFEWEEKKPIRIQLWDTAGDPRFDSITRSYLRDIAFVVFVTDITRASSYTALDKYIELVNEHCTNPFVERLVLGNKSDLEGQRVMTREDAHAFCNKRGLPYRELSAKLGNRVVTTFEQACINAINNSQMIWDNNNHGLRTGELHPRHGWRDESDVDLTIHTPRFKCCCIQ